jgi:hypothetical protein
LWLPSSGPATERVLEDERTAEEAGFIGSPATLLCRANGQGQAVLLSGPMAYVSPGGNRGPCRASTPRVEAHRIVARLRRTTGLAVLALC